MLLLRNEMHLFEFLSNKKTTAFAVLMSVMCTVSAAEWTLGAAKFTFTQAETRSSAQEGAASLIPQLILEQTMADSSRTLTNRELLDRTLEDLLTARLSLFLQLSKEVKARDSLVITEPDARSLKKKIAAENVKIAAIQKQIDDNLAAAEKAKSDAAQSIASEERPVADDSTAEGAIPDDKELGVFVPEADAVDDVPSGPLSFNKLFGIPKQAALPSVETIVLYKKDSSTLFTPSDAILEAGTKSREYEKAVTAEKINGLITGTITVYGDYASVTAELLIFPGAISYGVVTEVGSLSDCVQIAKNITRSLSPKIYNSMPIKIYFDITPKEAAEKAQVTIDGLVYDTVPDTAVVQAGIHTVTIDSEGWNSQTVTWNFKDIPSFLVHAALTEKKDGVLSVSLKKPYLGSFYGNGMYAGDTIPGQISASISVNGEPVIGQFVTDKRSVKKVKKEITDDNGNKTTKYVEEEGSLIGSFFYIPEGLATPDTTLIANVKPVDNASVIDKRRIWMYRGYSALLLSLPFAFYSYGNYNALYKGYKDNIITNVTELKKWQKNSWISIGACVVSGTFFVVELVRYLHAADAVIPTTVRKPRPGEIEKAISQSESLQKELSAEAEAAATSGDEDTATTSEDAASTSDSTATDKSAASTSESTATDKSVASTSDSAATDKSASASSDSAAVTNSTATTTTTVVRKKTTK